MASAFRYYLIGVALVIATHAGATQEVRDTSSGFAYANQVCSECHAVRRGERVSPHERAPAFQVVADAPGMSEMALLVWFQSPHPSMPNLLIKAQESDDLVAYILSLKQRR
jgi:mono/diheme cytochrome c family protein